MKFLLFFKDILFQQAHNVVAMSFQRWCNVRDAGLAPKRCCFNVMCPNTMLKQSRFNADSTTLFQCCVSAEQTTIFARITLFTMNTSLQQLLTIRILKFEQDIWFLRDVSKIFQWNGKQWRPWSNCSFGFVWIYIVRSILRKWKKKSGLDPDQISLSVWFRSVLFAQVCLTDLFSSKYGLQSRT